MTGCVASLLNSLKDDFNSLFVVSEIGGKSPLVTDASTQSLRVQNRLQGMKGLHRHTNGFGKTGSIVWGNLELLKIKGVVSMFAAVDDIETRHG